MLCVHLYHGLCTADGTNSRVTLLLAVLEVPHTLLLLLCRQFHTPCLLELVHDKRDDNAAFRNHGVHVVAVCLRSC